MANATLFSPANPHFFQPLLPGFEDHLKIPLTFFSKHIEGNYEGKIVTLISDASERTWKVKMEGHKLTNGWKEFVDAHDLRIGDFVIFRHEGDMLFHVTPIGPSCCEIQYETSRSQDEAEESDEIGESLRKKKKIVENVKSESDQSSSSDDFNSFSQSVTASNLSRDTVGVPIEFAKRNGLNNGRQEIVLMNEEGKSWKSELKSIVSNRVFITRGWTSFCAANQLEAGDSCTFKLLRNTEKPVFQLCSHTKSKPNTNIQSAEENRFVKLTPTPNSLNIGKQRLPFSFTRANGLVKAGKIILVDKNGDEWPMELKIEKSHGSGSTYIMSGNGWKSYCATNGVSAYESLTLELIRRGTSPFLKFCSKVHCISSGEYGASEDDDTWNEYSDSKNIVSMNKPRTESKSSSDNSYLVAHVTSSNLSRDRLCLLRDFARSNGLSKRCCEIDLENQHGKSWTLGLRYNTITDQANIRGGWRNFCFANGLDAESFYKFKLVRNGTRPLLRLCSDTIPEGNCSSKANGKDNLSEKPSNEYSENASTKQNKFLTLTFKPYMLTSGQLRLPRTFVSENRINEAGEITLMDKNGVKWPSYFNGLYMAKGWRSFIAANELKAGETFTLEYVLGEGTTPMLKFCSKAKVTIEQAPFDGSGRTSKASGVEEEEGEDEMETRVQKRARVSSEGGPSRRTLVSNKSGADPEYLERKQPIQHCSISDQVTKVKQSIVDTLTCVRRFRSELEIKEHNLEASLLEIDALGEKVLEVNKILK